MKMLMRTKRNDIENFISLHLFKLFGLAVILVAYQLKSNDFHNFEFRSIPLRFSNIKGLLPIPNAAIYIYIYVKCICRYIQAYTYILHIYTVLISTGMQTRTSLLKKLPFCIKNFMPTAIFVYATIVLYTKITRIDARHT